MDNRCGEKILRLLISEAFRRSGKGEKKRIDMVKKDIEKHMNTVVLGTENHPTQWCMTMMDHNLQVGAIFFPNTRVRTITNHINPLVGMCIDNQLDVDKLKTALCLYKRVIELARQKDDYTAEEIETYKDYCDKMANMWIPFFGAEGMTKYFHMMLSGHLRWYMLNYRNLYRYEQQGWEDLNSKLKYFFFFHRTQRGGSKGNTLFNGGKADHLKPVGKWLQRQVMWKTGLSDKVF